MALLRVDAVGVAVEAYDPPPLAKSGNSGRVLVDVSVTDADGVPVANLVRADFRLVTRTVASGGPEAATSETGEAASVR